MGFGVFLHRSDSIYDDVPAERYQFPARYLARARQCEGDWILYLEPSKVRQTRGYFAVAKVQQIIADPSAKGMFLALIAPNSYLDFGAPVPFSGADGIVERGLLNDAGRLSGRARAAVRRISPQDFARIVERGLGQDTDILPRTEAEGGFSDAPGMFDNPAVRLRTEVLTNRKVRDRNFRRIVLEAYGERCAFTGLRLINGGGRAEVEAAHIRPVADNGPDILNNGLALSGTVHWMFDRGLLSLSDNMDILVSRQVNDRGSVDAMLHPGGKALVPARAAFRPHATFVEWHRNKRFKD